MRGGYALAYLPTFDHGYNNGFSVTPTLVASTDGGITPAARLSNPYPAGLDQPVGSSQGLATLVGRAFTFSNPERTIPYVHQFSVGVQRELPGSMALDAAYVGSRTRGMAVSKGINEITAEQLAQGNAMLRRWPIRSRACCRARPSTARPCRCSSWCGRTRSSGASPRIAEPRLERLRLAAVERQQAHVEGPAVPRQLHLLADEEEVTYLNPQDDWDQLLRVVTAPTRRIV